MHNTIYIIDLERVWTVPFGRIVVAALGSQVCQALANGLYGSQVRYKGPKVEFDFGPQGGQDQLWSY